MKEQIAKELINLAQHDLLVREKLLKEGKLTGGYNTEMERVHKSNAARLREIIKQIGWPSKSKVGDEASEAAWLIVQHSIGEPVFMKNCYALMNESVSDVDEQNLAYLYDRICYFEGRPQKYGTQFDDGRLYPVENKDELNNWRQQLKLNPHPVESIVEVKPSDHLEDLHQGNKEFNEWRKTVGWI